MIKRVKCAAIIITFFCAMGIQEVGCLKKKKGKPVKAIKKIIEYYFMIPEEISAAVPVHDMQCKKDLQRMCRHL